MTVDTVPISSLRTDPHNARAHNAKNLKAISGSLKKFGQQKPIIIDSKGIIRAGNGTYAAALALGWTEIQVVKTELKGAALKAFALADNRTAELAEWDSDELFEQLQELESFDLASIGFDDADIEKLLKEVESEGEGSGSEKCSSEENSAGTFAVYTECNDEADQKAVLELLADRGLSPRGLISAMPRRFTAPLQPKNETKSRSGLQIIRSSPIDETARVMQLRGMFDLPPSGESREEWNVNISFPTRWNIGVIVGPSGSGKSTIARELFGDCVVAERSDNATAAVIDLFPVEMSIGDATDMLCRVGFSSPPAWLKPFHVLSTGQKFRVELALTLAAATLDKQPKAVDEFTSVVDRTVAQIGSAAVAKAVRQYGLQFVAVTCHYDVIPWLQPDWTYDVAAGKLTKPP